MKKLKLVLLTLLSVISFGVMSQTIIYTTPASGPNICDGTAVLDTTSLYGNILTWNYQGAPIQVGGYMIDSLCPGTYTFTYIDTTNSFEAVAFTIGYNSTPVGYGDTLTINGPSCVNPVSWFFNDDEDCNLDYNAIDTAYLSNVLVSTTSGTILTYWNIVDTLGNIDTLGFLNPFFGSVIGCYDFTLILYCSQKSLDYKTLEIRQGFQVDSFVGIEELTPNDKTIVKITDILGRECKPEEGELHIIRYSDGSIEKVIRN